MRVGLLGSGNVGKALARVLEPMASLYCAIGNYSGEWSMAFKLLRTAPD